MVVSLLEYEDISDSIAGHTIVKDIAISISILWVVLLDSVLYISYYNWQKAAHLLKTKWKEQLLLIDKIQNKNTSKQPWTLKYHHIVSKPKYVLIIAVTYWLFYLVTIMYVYIIYSMRKTLFV